MEKRLRKTALVFEQWMGSNEERPDEDREEERGGMERRIIIDNGMK
jgi:hypothetical protein